MKASSQLEKTELIKQLNGLSPAQLKEIEASLTQLKSNKPKKNAEETKKEAIEALLAKLQKDPHCKILHIKLAKRIQEDWAIIRRYHLLTHFLINCLTEFEKVGNEQILHQRITRGSDSGTFLENTFGLLVEWYFSSQNHLWSNDGIFRYDMKINQPVIIPGNRNKKKADLIMSDRKTGKALVVIELKKSFAKSSLKRVFVKEYEQYKKLGPEVNYHFIIFNCSKTKSKTYKQIAQCRVICNDYGLLERQISVKIIDSVELILEEILTHLNNVYDMTKTIELSPGKSHEENELNLENARKLVNAIKQRDDEPEEEYVKRYIDAFQVLVYYQILTSGYKELRELLKMKNGLYAITIRCLKTMAAEKIKIKAALTAHEIELEVRS